VFHLLPFLFVRLLAQEHQSLLHSIQAESSRTVNEKTPGASQEPSGPGQLLELISSLGQSQFSYNVRKRKVLNKKCEGTNNLA